MMRSMTLMSEVWSRFLWTLKFVVILCVTPKVWRETLIFHELICRLRVGYIITNIITKPWLTFHHRSTVEFPPHHLLLKKKKIMVIFIVYFVYDQYSRPWIRTNHNIIQNWFPPNCKKLSSLCNNKLQCTEAIICLKSNIDLSRNISSQDDWWRFFFNR